MEAYRVFADAALDCGLVRLMLEKRLRALQHGVAPVRLTV